MSDRAGIFDDISDFDLSGFAPKQGKPAAETPPEIVRAVSEASSFRSREPMPATKDEPFKKDLRRYRTGRNVQLNIKVRAETLRSFYEVADREG